MKKILLGILLMLAIPCMSFSADYRVFGWDSSVQEVDCLTLAGCMLASKPVSFNNDTGFILSLDGNHWELKDSSGVVMQGDANLYYDLLVLSSSDQSGDLAVISSDGIGRATTGFFFQLRD
ncbi:MAG TPA: hypothetical protein VEI96_04335 [Thermodesulfovibrionales bacterium]|nr:hypothetical protein [Thermodesulfovibrionales bacterium]